MYLTLLLCHPGVIYNNGWEDSGQVQDKGNNSEGSSVGTIFK